MMLDLQKASLLKRASARLLDLILLVIIIVGFSAILSHALNYDHHSKRLDEYYTQYESEYGIEFDMSVEKYEAMTEDERKLYETAYNALISDEDAMYTYHLLVNLTLLITSISILFGYLVLEFFVPLKFGNGQTIGKKIFGIALMRTGGIKITPVCLFIRTVLGKYTIETMLPVLVMIMIFFGNVGIIGIAILALLVITQIILLFAHRNHVQIHDLLADTVAVDMASQMIFDTAADLTAYQQKLYEKNVAIKTY